MEHEVYKGYVLAPGIVMPAQDIHDTNVYASEEQYAKDEPVHIAESVHEAKRWVDGQSSTGKNPTELEDVRVWAITDEGKRKLAILEEEGYAFKPTVLTLQILGMTVSWIILDILDKKGPLTSAEIHGEEIARWGYRSSLPLPGVEDELEYLLNLNAVSYHIESRPRPPLMGRLVRGVARWYCR